MRPQPIVLFERLYLLSVLLSVVSVALYWNALAARVSPVLMAAFSAAWLGVLVVLVLLVSRRRFAIAKWLLVLLTVTDLALALPSLPRSLAAGPAGWLGVLETVLQVAAVAFLFTAPARAWLRGARNAA